MSFHPYNLHKIKTIRSTINSKNNINNLVLKCIYKIYFDTYVSYKRSFKQIKSASFF